MKKKTLAAVLIALGVARATAQTPWFHIYFTDESDFISMPLEDYKGVRFTSVGNNFTKMTVSSAIGDESADIENVKKWIIGSNVATLRVTTEELIVDISDKETRYPGTLEVDGAGIYADIPPTPITFRGRGNSTLNYSKKPYNIKFDTKTRICDFRKAKSYVLLANWIDGSFMRNYAAFSAANALGMPYANSCRPVDVYLNDDYKGTYTLTQKVGFNNGSVDLTADDEANSVMIELDTCDPAAGITPDYGGYSRNYMIPYQLKDPDAPADKDEALVWWYEWAEDFEALEGAVARGEDTSSLVDYTTLAKYLMVYNIACNQELNHPKSVMLWKTKGGKWQFGPCWDFDWAFGYKQTYVNYDYSSGSNAELIAKHKELVEYFSEKNGDNPYAFDMVQKDGTWYYWLSGEVFVEKNGGLTLMLESVAELPSYQSPLLGTGKNTQSGPYGHGGEFFLNMIKDNKAFMDEYARVWAEFQPKINDLLKQFDSYALELEPSANREVKVWPLHHTLNHAEAVKELKTWLKNRLEYISDPANNYGLY